MTRLAILATTRGADPTPPPPPAPPKGVFGVAEPWKWRDLTTMANWDDLSKAATFDGGTYKSKGGFHRDIPTTGPTSGEWGPSHFATDIADAKAGGLDGWLADITNPKTTDANYQRILKSVTAAGVAGSFTVIPWVDINGGAFNGVPGGTSSAMTPEAVATQIATDFMSPSNPVALFNGSYWVGSFKAEGDSIGKIAGMAAATYWGRFFTKIRTLVTDHPIKFWPCILYPSSANFTAFAAFSDMASIWGPARPGTNVSNLATWANLAHSLGMDWGGPVRPTNDVRAYSAVYAESENSLLGRQMWDRAISIDNAKHVLLVTWNDYAENTQIQPSRNNGRAALWMTKFYADWFRNGTAPTISSPKIILSNRIHTSSATVTTAGLTATTCTLDGGGTHPYDKTEALVFADQDYTLFINGVSKGTVHAGVTSTLATLTTGAVQTAQLKTGATVIATATGTDAPTTTTPRADFDYRWAQS